MDRCSICTVSMCKKRLQIVFMIWDLILYVYVCMYTSPNKSV